MSLLVVAAGASDVAGAASDVADWLLLLTGASEALWCSCWLLLTGTSELSGASDAAASCSAGTSDTAGASDTA